MSTATVVPTEATGAIETSKQTYRSYAQFGEDKDGKTVITKIKAQAEADKKDKSGLSVNWAKLEEEKDKEGNKLWTLVAENEFVRYTVKTLEGFQMLVPDAAQQTYIIQCGLNYIQNAKANAAMTELVDGAPEPTAKYQGETIDLRTGVGENGEFSINEAPSRKSLSDVDKLVKQLRAMGIADDQIESVLTAMAAAKAASEVGQEVAA